MPNELDGVFIHRGRLVSADAIIDDGVVIVQQGVIAYAGTVAGIDAHWEHAVTLTAAQPDRYILPGLVDIHCHGGGGGSFPDALDRDEAQVAIAEHRRHGTTSLVASLVTGPPAVLRERVAMLAGLVDEGELAGIHLEGPFVSPERCGAQNPAFIQTPDPRLVAELCELAHGGIVTMTLAPEIPGNCGPGSVTEALIAHDALPSFGHTDAAQGQMRTAIDGAGKLLRQNAARSELPTVTHLFNGMRPLQHREAGPVLDALTAAASGLAVVELVGDGTHLNPALVREVFELVGADHIMLITDAMAAAGMADGRYRLGSLAVRVRDGVARLDGENEAGAIAGGTAHLIDVVRTTVAGGVPLVDAVKAASATPARVLGRSDIGVLQAGRRADVLVVDDELRVCEVWRGGELVPSSRTAR